MLAISAWRSTATKNHSAAQVPSWQPMALTGFQTEMQNCAIKSHFLCTASKATGRHWLHSCRRSSKGEQRKSMRVRTLHPCNFKMELHCSKKYAWDGWIKRMWDCCCWKWSGGAPCLTAVQQQEEGIWVHEEENEEEVEEEVQLYERFRPSSWGLFRQKTNITRPIIDRCCCSGYQTQPKHGSEAKKRGAPVSSTGQQTYTTLNHLTTT